MHDDHEKVYHPKKGKRTDAPVGRSNLYLWIVAQILLFFFLILGWIVYLTSHGGKEIDLTSMEYHAFEYYEIPRFTKVTFLMTKADYYAITSNRWLIIKDSTGNSYEFNGKKYVPDEFRKDAPDPTSSFAAINYTWSTKKIRISRWVDVEDQIANIQNAKNR